jgi:hypothetical protein
MDIRELEEEMIPWANAICFGLGFYTLLVTISRATTEGDGGWAAGFGIITSILLILGLAL